MNQSENQQTREYLLGMASEDEAEQIELRLLSDREYAEQFGIVVDEIVDEYIQGQFEGRELQQVEQEFFKSAQRREKLNFAKALYRVQTEQGSSLSSTSKTLPTRPSSPVVKYYLPIAAVILIALGVGFSLWYRFQRPSPTDEALIALNAAYDHQRPTESRLSSFHYAPYDPKRGTENANINQLDLRRAELTLLQMLATKPTPAVHHALGQVYLAKKQIDDSIKEFDEAIKGDKTNAVIYSDLGAAWLEKGKASLNSEQGKSFEAFAHSLDQLKRALELNPNLLEALFNRALVRQYLKLTDEAKADWEDYLRKDLSTGWANDARDHLKQLENRERSSTDNSRDLTSDFLAASAKNDAVRGWELIRDNRNSAPAGRLIRDQLLDEFIQVSVTGEKDEADKNLRALTFAGKIESDQLQDVFTSRLAQFYARTTAKDQDVLKIARQLMSLGQTYHGQSRPADAIPVFEQSKQLFSRVNDSLEADNAELWIGYCHINAKNTEQAISILARLAPHFERQGYKTLQVRALNLLAGAEYNFGEYSRAIQHNRRALHIAEQVQDSRSAFSVLSILIEQFRYIGNFEEAFECIQRSLTLIGSWDLNDFQLGQYFTIIAAALSSANLDRVAVDYQEAGLEALKAAGQVQTVSRAYTNLGAIYGRLSKYDVGLQQANLGYQTAATLSDERVRQGMLAYASQRIGDLHRQAGNLPQAIKSYSECVAIYKNIENHYGMYEAHKSLLLCHLAAGDDVAAEQDLGNALDLMEQYRSQILEEDNRNHFFSAEQTIYDLAIDYEYSRKHNREKAFEYSEASRSRSLLDLVRSKGAVSTPISAGAKPNIIFKSMSKPLVLREIQSQIPEQVLLVQYALLKDKLLIWIISRTAPIQSFLVSVTQDDLQEKITTYVRLLNDGPSRDEEIVRLAKDLFSLLISPIEKSLDKSQTIYFVPDKALNWLPFNSLVSPSSGHFLIQDYSTAIVPSSTLFIASSNRARVLANTGDERMLAIGNPSFDKVEFPTLEDLPSAKTEAEQIGLFYNNRTVLTERQAARLPVEAEMERAQIIHFAVHSQVDSNLPLQSKLILAKVDGRASTESYLEAQDIYKMNLGQARLVVLSSCESGIGKYYAGEGVMSLARPFLAANVPLVVASLWPVDSGSTTELMIGLHRHRKLERMSTVEALRRAQLDLIHSPNAKARRVSSWTAFVPVGGWAEF